MSPSSDDPRRPGEVLEPQPRQQVVQPPAAPPVIDLADDPGVIGLGRPPEREASTLGRSSGTPGGRDGRGQRPGAARAVRTSGRDSRRWAARRPRVRAKSHRPTWPRTTAASARPVASQIRRARGIVAPAPTFRAIATAQPPAAARTTRPAETSSTPPDDRDGRGDDDRDDHDRERDPAGRGRARRSRGIVGRPPRSRRRDTGRTAGGPAGARPGSGPARVRRWACEVGSSMAPILAAGRAVRVVASAPAAR